MKNIYISIFALFTFILNSYAFASICENSQNCKYRHYSKSNYLNYYSTKNIENSDSKVERLVIVVHGALRNGDTYFDDTVKTIKNLSLEDSVLLIAPHFRKVTDVKEKNEHYWGRKWYTKWKYGYISEDSDQISSFEIIDNLILEITKSGNFPNLKTIVITGHSAGGQFTQRYAVGSKIQKEVKQKVVFAPSNPSSYMYLHKNRYHFKDGNFKSKNIPSECPEFNEYIYGLKNRAKYLAKYSSDELIKNYSSQNIVYLMSEEDKGVDSLDRTCEAMTQGINRFNRAKNYYYYVKKQLPNNSHIFSSIAAIGHEHIDVYSSLEAKEYVFGIQAELSSHEADGFKYKKIGSLLDKKATGDHMFLMLGGGKNEKVGISKFISRANGGDLLVISAKVNLNHRYTHDFWNISEESGIKLNSVSTISFLDRKAGNSKFILEKIKNAEAIFFTGGDQSKYINRIKGTKAHKLLLSKIDTIAIAGTSAGLAIMGEYIFSAKKGGLGSSYALKNPHSEYITIEEDFFYSSLLKGIITDTHFSERSREGRLLSFMHNAQFSFSLKSIMGIGVDEQTSIAVTQSEIQVFGQGSAWVYESSNDASTYQMGALNFGPIKYKEFKAGQRDMHFNQLNTSKWKSLKVSFGEVTK